jgi:hypothetical protein
VPVGIAGLVAVMFWSEYVEGRRAGEWNYQSNMWMALASAAIGAAGFLWPRVIGWCLLPFAVLWLLWALAYAGISFPALVVGGIPLAVPILLILSGRPRRRRSSDQASPDEGV